ncbi:hypothetical protein [Dendrosporobacter sp. 1207_IL3150]|uniref:hypothetical protein n=1 Tax=Dendrosporobacter sp. 1207_IL3150 TaxID=3084054 RepID=UPI002FD9B3AE
MQDECDVMPDILTEEYKAVLKNLASKFTDILGYKVDFVLRIQDKQHWHISYISQNGFALIVSLCNTSGSRLYNGFYVDRPTVFIYRFDVRPSGKGFGSKIIDILLGEIYLKTNFERVGLLSNAKVDGFWCKLGFEHFGSDEKWMKFDLTNKKYYTQNLFT